MKQHKETPADMRRRPVSGSESVQLRALSKMLDAIKVGGPDVPAILYIQDKLEQMAILAEAGIHQNPGALIVYGNPGLAPLTVNVGPVLGFVEQLKYERTVKPKGYYFHDFGSGDALVVGTLDGSKQKIVLVMNVNGKPLWGPA